MRVLHITRWYPHKEEPLEAIWIKRLIEPVDPESEVYHLCVTPSKKLKIRYSTNGRVKHRIWELPTKKWIIIEIVNFFLLGHFLLMKRFKNDFDLINFHIAYPQLVFWSALKFLVNKPVVVSEHWSAYHFNFGVGRKLPRIQWIFKHGLPFITVSKSLAEDIKSFSQQADLKIHQVPNVVDVKDFKLMKAIIPDQGTFFMVSQWKWPKQPKVVLNAFAALVARGECDHYKLRIAGYGPQLEELKMLSYSLGLNERVCFLGPLTSELIADEMNRCTAFLHCSEYETFSVVCAEALCCGAPVVASNVGAIAEYVNSENGILVGENTPEVWLKAIEKLRYSEFNRSVISSAAQKKFATANVRLQYIGVLKSICGAHK